LRTVLDFLRKGDVLMVTRIDRLARSIGDLETNLRRERQLEGIAKAKAAGVYKGRPASIDAAQVRQMKPQGMGRRATEIAKALGIHRASLKAQEIRSQPIA
jgi:DNA invertase Pin-like site-specific DNA recombinase